VTTKTQARAAAVAFGHRGSDADAATKQKTQGANK
jgi:hypothetical protein